MFRKRDIIMISIVLCIALASYGIVLRSRSGQMLTNMVELSVNNVLYDTVPLGVTRRITIRQENGDVNIVEVDAKGARMVESSCKNQLCVHQSAVTVDNWMYRSLGRAIICLPNRVIVELSIDNAQQVQLEQDLADV